MSAQNIKIPKVKKISNSEMIGILREEIRRKDKIISKLKEENELLLKISLKHAKKKLEQDL